MSLDTLNFKEISLVPDYKALEIIKENKQELKSFLDTGEPIIVDICKNSTYRSFQQSLNDVEEYLVKRSDKIQLDADKAYAIGRDLKQQLKCTKEEVVMILNMLPVNESILEMMFPGRFNKEDTSRLMQVVNGHLGISMEQVQVKKEEPIDCDD